ncbi:MAG: hypothetical protein ACUVRD_08375 [Bacteroidia bacterium]
MINTLGTLRDKIVFTLSFVFLGLTRAEYLPLFVVIGVYLYLTDRSKLKFIFSSLGILLVALVLNGVKNQRIFGVFRLTNFGAGTVIYGGNNLTSGGSWHPWRLPKGYLPDKYKRILDSLYKTASPAQVCVLHDSIFLKAALDAWRADWLYQLKVIPTKFAKLWFWPGTFDFYTGQKEVRPGLQVRYGLNYLLSDDRWPWYGKYKHLAILIVYWLSLVVSLLGIYIKAKTHGLDKVDGLLLFFVILPTVLCSTVFYGLGRFHSPIVPILFYWSIYLFDAVTYWWSKRKTTK